MTSRPWQTLQRATLVHTGGERYREHVMKIAADCECYGNNRYTVSVRRCKPQDPEHPVLIHLSIHDHDRTASHDWRDLQRIKNDICGPEAEAIEIYPAESRLIDNANEFHLWCWEGMKIPCGWQERLVSEESIDLGSSKQRRWPDSDRPKDLTFLSEEMLAAAANKT
jgi:hypothetical protein